MQMLNIPQHSEEDRLELNSPNGVPEIQEVILFQNLKKNSRIG